VGPAGRVTFDTGASGNAAMDSKPVVTGPGRPSKAEAGNVQRDNLAPPPKAKRGMPTAETLVEEGRRRGFAMEIPFAIDDDIAAAADREVGPVGTAVERLRRLIGFLNDRGALYFQYTKGMSLTARQAFHEKRGDCMAYTNLYVGAARHLGIPVYFVHISQARDYFERDGFFFVSTHMAVGYGGGKERGQASPYVAVVDFAQEVTGTSLLAYRSIDDATATALFYNNVAVNLMVAGETGKAEAMLRFLMEKCPDLKEPYNNLGVLLVREGRYDEALTLLKEAIGRFPAEHPLYTNAIQAARGAQDREEAAALDQEGQKLAGSDPFYLFNQGVECYLHKDAACAEARFRSALAVKPDNPFLLAWLARACLARGEVEAGQKAFAEAQLLGPTNPMLSLLRETFPDELAQVPMPSNLPR
jgi:tetratricopeptide (TPR) repeat protein